jgi:hypothetical protein
MIERIADHAAPTRIRAIDPELQALLADMPIEIEITDAGLNEGAGIALVDLENPVHPFQVRHGTARQHRRRRPR